jgi:hypothetical protein
MIFREPGFLEVVQYDLAPRPPPSPLPSANSLSFSVFCLSPGRERETAWGEVCEEPNHTTARKTGLL